MRQARVFPPMVLLGILVASNAAAEVTVFDDFESGNMSAWTRTGTAFGAQPSYGNKVAIGRVSNHVPGITPLLNGDPATPASTLGGDYWKGPWYINQLGNWWVGTYENRNDPAASWTSVVGDGTTGVAWRTLPAFSADKSYISFMVGGGSAAGLSARIMAPLTPAEKAACDASCPPSVSWCAGLCDGLQFITVEEMTPYYSLGELLWSSTSIYSDSWGHNDERMRRISWHIPSQYWGRTDLRFEIVDNETGDWGHINVDHIVTHGTMNEIVSVLPQGGSSDPSVWGMADLHTHWMAKLGFGSVKVKNTIGTGAAPDTYVPGTACQGAFNGSPYGKFGRYHDYVAANPALTEDQKEGLALRNAITGHGPSGGGGGVSPSWDGHFNSYPQGDATYGWSHTSCYDERVPDNYPAGAAARETRSAVDKFAYQYERVTATSPTIVPGSGGDEGWYPEEQRQTGSNGLAPGLGFRKVGRPFMENSKQQMYVEWVKRAWRGGMRLIVTHAVNNRSVEAAVKPVTGEQIAALQTTLDTVTVRRQTCAMRRILHPSLGLPEFTSFAAVAYTPAEARSIIQSGKMAVVLGAEVDELPSTNPDTLKNLGIRHVFPVHLADNAAGGQALYNDIFNANSRLLQTCDASGLCMGEQWRTSGCTFRNAGPEVVCDASGDPKKARGYYGASSLVTFGHRDGDLTCGTESSACQNWLSDRNHFGSPFVSPLMAGLANVEEGCGASSTRCVKWKLKPRVPLGAIDVITHIGYVGWSVVFTMMRIGAYDQPSLNGHRNMLGLTAAGENFVELLMRRGMIIDIDHTSLKLRSRLTGIPVENPTGGPIVAEKNIIGATPACRAEGSMSGVREPLKTKECLADAYPLVASHANFASLIPQEARSEYSQHDSDLDVMYLTKGMVGLALGIGGRWNAPVGSRVPNDCAGSSKSFAQLVYHARNKFSEEVAASIAPPNGRPNFHNAEVGIALGSDFNGMASHLGPRFGRDACFGSEPPRGYDPSQPDGVAQGISRTLEAMTQINTWGNGVTYNGFSPDGWKNDLAGWAGPMEPFMLPDGMLPGVPGVRASYTINDDGLANYGLIPELIQDVANASGAAEYWNTIGDLAPLFRGAEQYIRTWEQSIKSCKARSGAEGSQFCDPAASLIDAHDETSCAVF